MSANRNSLHLQGCGKDSAKLQQHEGSCRACCHLSGLHRQTGMLGHNEGTPSHPEATQHGDAHWKTTQATHTQHMLKIPLRTKAITFAEIRKQQESMAVGDGKSHPSGSGERADFRLKPEIEARKAEAQERCLQCTDIFVFNCL